MEELLFRKTKSVLTHPTTRPRDPLTTYEAYTKGELIGHIDSRWKPAESGHAQGADSSDKTWLYWLEGRDTGDLSYNFPGETFSKAEAGRLLLEEYKAARMKTLIEKIEAALTALKPALGAEALAAIQTGQSITLWEYKEIARLAATAALDGLA